MKAVGKYIVVDEIKEKTSKTEGGLLLSDKQKENIRYKIGDVIKVGDLVNAIREDDKFYFDQHAGFDIELDSKIYKVIKEQDIVIIL